MKVELTYFKESGKFYTTGEHDTAHEYLGDIWDEIITLARSGVMPGLHAGSNTRFFALVRVPSHPHDHPRLLVPDDLRAADAPLSMIEYTAHVDALGL